MLIVKKAAPGCSSKALSRFAEQAREAVGLRGKVNVLLTSSRDLRALNRRFRGKDQPTDVLSFPAIDIVARHYAGDIVISSEIALRNARRYRHSCAQEVKVLIVHGMLHLAGYDHERDRGRMAREEERLRDQLGLGDGLIMRTTGRQSSVARRQIKRSANGRGRTAEGTRRRSR